MRWLALALVWTGCTGTFTPVLPDDDVPSDSGSLDSAADSGSTDSGPGDSGAGDSGMTDSGAAMAVDSFEHDGSTATVFCEDLSAEARTYRLVSDHPLRDNLPASGEVTIVERPGQMRLRSGRPLLDALFALAMQEVRDASVSQITDGSFGAPVDCPCFETGEKWTWVWTRDTGYAVEHALAMVDPQRSRDSLLFKLSDQKPSLGGGRPTIVQDTGSGGSWPVSTDRAVWALGAWETLKFLEGSEREAFRDVAYEALVNTLDEDRQWVYAPADGLYRGEQSFLDWREQSYPSWTAQDTVHLAMSRSLSTNLAHLRMMQITRELALEVGDSAVASRMGTWADALAQAIDEQLWLPEYSQYSAMKTTGR